MSLQSLQVEWEVLLKGRMENAWWKVMLDM